MLSYSMIGLHGVSKVGTSVAQWCPIVVLSVPIEELLRLSCQPR